MLARTVYVCRVIHVMFVQLLSFDVLERGSMSCNKLAVLGRDVIIWEEESEGVFE